MKSNILRKFNHYDIYLLMHILKKEKKHYQFIGASQTGFPINVIQPYILDKEKILCNIAGLMQINYFSNFCSVRSKSNHKMVEYIDSTFYDLLYVLWEKHNVLTNFLKNNAYSQHLNLLMFFDSNQKAMCSAGILSNYFDKNLTIEDLKKIISKVTTLKAITIKPFCPTWVKLDMLHNCIGGKRLGDDALLGDRKLIVSTHIKIEIYSDKYELARSLLPDQSRGQMLHACLCYFLHPLLKFEIVIHLTKSFSTDLRLGQSPIFLGGFNTIGCLKNHHIKYIMNENKS